MTMDECEDPVKGKMKRKILPHTCIFIDAEIKHFITALRECTVSKETRRKPLTTDLKNLFTTEANPNPALPCLSVRTAFDLFLRVKGYPRGSEVIMSAVNIPDMTYIVQYHGFKIVPLDVDIDTTCPKLGLLPSLITDKTVAIVVAHIYGKWNNIDQIIQVAHSKSIDVIEDCAETFCGLDILGNPCSDLSLFSFGVIKTSTAFGGAIAKVKDKFVYKQMCQLHETYLVQGHLEYAKKVMKYLFVSAFLSSSNFVSFGMSLSRAFNYDHKRLFVKLLRGFPNQLIQKIRHQPCTALLYLLKDRVTEFSQDRYRTRNVKAEYVRKRLPREITVVGTCSDVNNYWLFPILVEKPDQFVIQLNALGVDAYRGATQLRLVEAHPAPSPVANSPCCPQNDLEPVNCVSTKINMYPSASDNRNETKPCEIGTAVQSSESCRPISSCSVNQEDNNKQFHGETHLGTSQEHVHPQYIEDNMQKHNNNFLDASSSSLSKASSSSSSSSSSSLLTSALESSSKSASSLSSPSSLAAAAAASSLSASEFPLSSSLSSTVASSLSTSSPLSSSSSSSSEAQAFHSAQCQKVRHGANDQYHQHGANLNSIIENEHSHNPMQSPVMQSASPPKPVHAQQRQSSQFISDGADPQSSEFKEIQRSNFRKHSPSVQKIMPFDPADPKEARYLIDHVVYLPVNKLVPFQALDYIISAVHLTLNLSKRERKVHLPSKL